MPDLKLAAFDAEDLAVLSAHLQDALVRTGDMVLLPRERRFVLVCSRFDRSEPGRYKAGREAFVRRRTGVRFETVRGARLMGIDRGQDDAILVLLSVGFDPAGPETPEGTILLTFAGGGAVRLDVECIEAALADLGAAWETTRKPEHEV